MVANLYSESFTFLYMCKSKYVNLYAWLMGTLSIFSDDVYSSFTNNYSTTSGEDGDFEEVIFSWICFSLITVLFSLVITFNEEFDTSIASILFDILFVTVVTFYIPDIFGFCYNRLNYLFFNLTLFSVCCFSYIISWVGNLLKIVNISFRINTNYLSGHLILSFVLIMTEFFLILFKFSDLFFNFILVYSLFIIECLIAFLQLYVLVILCYVYFEENLY